MGLATVWHRLSQAIQHPDQPHTRVAIKLPFLLRDPEPRGLRVMTTGHAARASFSSQRFRRHNRETKTSQHFGHGGNRPRRRASDRRDDQQRCGLYRRCPGAWAPKASVIHRCPTSTPNATLPRSARRQIHGFGNQLPRRERLRGSHRCLTPWNQAPGDSGKSSPLAKICYLVGYASECIAFRG